ncbi:MAG: SGNH/GDSL hydrolase family protein [Anaerolineae bacterium]|nr:SGNH/GDSL hydrolase family protein [Anaerolineae bacterium]
MPRFLALGDSYTIGESVSEVERWPMRLAAMLEAVGSPVTVTIIAQTGWTTDELAAAIEQAAPQGAYDLVSLLIGVNNQYRGRDPSQYQLEFRQLLAKAITFAGGEPGRVIVLSIPDWGVTPFAEGRDLVQIAQEIDTFNALNRAEAEQQGAAYIDVTPISRQAAADPALIASDGLHPSGKMYGVWAELAFAAACVALGSPK